MSIPIGAQAKVGIGVETSFGSGVTITAFQPVYNASLDLSYQNQYVDKMQDSPEQVNAQTGHRTVTGSIAFPVAPKTSVLWWRAGLGQEASPFYVERPLDSLSIELDAETASVKASGCAVSALAFTSAQGGELQCTAAIEGKDLASNIATSATFTSGDAGYVHSEAVFTLNGTEDNSVTAWNLEVNNNPSVDIFGTLNTRLEIPAGKLQVSGSFTKVFDDTTERNAFLANSVRSLKVNYNRGTNYLIFWLPKIKYDSRPQPISGQSEYIVETFNFTAYVDDPAKEQSLRMSGDAT